MKDARKANAALVEALGSALREGDHGLKTAPPLLARVLREGSWREFVTQRGEPVDYERFEQFVVTQPLKGLGATPRLVEKVIDAIEDVADRKQVRDLYDQAVQRSAGGSRKIVLTDDIVHSEDDLARPSGNSESAALRRLRKGAPELHAEVLAGRLSAHAAMVQAGFRPKTISVPVSRPESIAAALRKHLGPDDLARLVALLANND